MSLGTYRRKPSGPFEIFYADMEKGPIVIAKGIRKRRDARIMAEAFEMYGLLEFMMLWADEKGLVGLIEKIQRIRARVNNPVMTEDAPEGVG